MRSLSKLYYRRNPRLELFGTQKTRPGKHGPGSIPATRRPGHRIEGTRWTKHVIIRVAIRVARRVYYKNYKASSGYNRVSRVCVKAGGLVQRLDDAAFRFGIRYDSGLGV